MTAPTRFLYLATALLLFNYCTPKTGTKTSRTPAVPPEPAAWVDPKPDMGDPSDTSEMEERTMDGIDIRPEMPLNLDTLQPYNPSHTFEVDLLHEKVELSFDWAKKHANGRATLTMRPWFYPTDKVTLDAKNFDIQSVTFEGQTAALPFEYNNEELTIQLGRSINRTEDFKIVVTYTAKPDERENIGGSDAITQDKGLYFINADGSEKDKPRQIWTQGETESNSFWMPTIDKPNERCTQEMYLTIEDKYKTLSNGVLVSSKKNADGTRTDYWKMDKPHAPYLFMMAIGEYAVVKERWHDIDIEYYVEPKYEQYAREIYPYTTEMLEFFSKKLGYNYPWSKFSQVVVRDYVSGAMENTTAIIYGEYVQKNHRELLDDHQTNELVVAHEMFHHWFGDLVTTENWANLTLNEGFANYSEYLWLEHKNGREEADFHLMTEMQGYMYSAADGGHPLINFGYSNREDMFDAHSYNKGGCTLHMLRDLVGDDAFFTALNRYLRTNEYTAVEADELRLAFEEVTGQDLNWFWNQWYFGTGHPSLDIKYDYDATGKKVNVTIMQEQLAGNGVPNVFDLPMSVDIYDASGKARRERIRMTKRSQTFSFAAAEKPALVNVDATKSLICIKTDHHTPEEWAFMYQHAPLFLDRYEALNGLEADAPGTAAITMQALTDKHAAIRQRAMSAIDPKNAAALVKVAAIAANDPDPATRAQAMSILGETGDKQYIPVLQKGLGADQAYSVVGAALSALLKLDLPAAVAASKALENDESPSIISTLAELYANAPDRNQLPWFQQQGKKIDQMAAFAFFEQYQKFLAAIGDVTLLDAGIEEWKSNALDPKNNSEWRRFASVKAIADTRNEIREKGDTAKADVLTKMIEDIKEKETDPTLKLYYGLF